MLETDGQAIARYHKMRQYATRDADNKDINRAALLIQKVWKAYRKRTGAQQLFHLSDSLQANLVSAMTMKKPKRKKTASTKKKSRIGREAPWGISTARVADIMMNEGVLVTEGKELVVPPGGGLYSCLYEAVFVKVKKDGGPQFYFFVLSKILFLLVICVLLCSGS